MKFHKLLTALMVLMVLGSITTTYAQTVQIDSGKAKDGSGKREFVTNIDTVTMNGVKVVPRAISAQIMWILGGSVIATDTTTRRTTGYKDTLTADSCYRTVDFAMQYLHVIATITRIDTNAVVWDSVYFYNIDEYGDTSMVGVRYLSDVQDSGLVRVNWTQADRKRSRELLIYHPAINLLHVRIENYALQDRKVIIGLQGVK